MLLATCILLNSLDEDCKYQMVKMDSQSLSATQISTDAVEEHMSLDPASNEALNSAFEISTNNLDLYEKSNFIERPHACDLCSKSFRRNYELERHKATHSKVYNCKACKKRFLSALDFRIHKKYHNRSKLIQCDECDQGFISKNRLKKHKISHSSDRPFKCSLCNKSYKYQIDLTTHKVTKHSDERPFKCDKCEHAFKIRPLLKRHKRIYHHEGNTSSAIVKVSASTESVETPNPALPETTVPNQLSIIKNTTELLFNSSVADLVEINFTCNICDLICKSIPELQEHVSIHVSKMSETLSVKSQNCAKIGEDKVQEDSKTVDEKYPFKCSTCDRRFKNNRFRRLHEVFHSNEKPYKCKVCEKGFKCLSNLRRHNFVHITRRSFKCDQCLQTFKCKQSLNKHYKLHLKGGPLKCDLCDQRFRSKFLLNCHSKKHQLEKLNQSCSGEDKITEDKIKSKETNQDYLLVSEGLANKKLKNHESGEKPLNFKKSNKHMNCLSNVNRHQHTRVSALTYSCSHCGKKFNTKSIFYKHKMEHNFPKPFTRKICDKSFQSKSQLCKHKKIHKLVTSEASSKTNNNHTELNAEINALEKVKNLFELKESESFRPSTMCEISSDKEPTYKTFLREDKVQEDSKTVDEKYPFKCSTCDRRFKKIRFRRLHEVFHSNEKPYKCKVCEKGFKCLSNLRRHNFVHITRRSFKCDQCLQTFKCKQSLNKHYKLHLKGGPLKCDLCDQRFRSKFLLNCHLKKHQLEKLNQFCSGEDKITEDKIKSKKTNQDDLLVSKGSADKKLKNHESGKKPFKGKKSNKTFSYRSYENIHELLTSEAPSKNHDSHAEFNAEIDAVDKDINSLDSPSKNLRNSTLARRIKTKIVTQSNRCRIEVQMQKIVPSNRRLFKCRHCLYTFPLRELFEKHLKTHSAESQYEFKCAKCHRSFNSLVSLKTHEARHSEKRPYQCQLCAKCFKTLADLKGHCFSHSVSRPYKCKECDGAFVSKPQLLKHKKLHLEHRFLKCQLCDKMFSSNSELRRHITSHVESNQGQTNEKAITNNSEITYDVPIPSVSIIEVKNDKQAGRPKKTYNCSYCDRSFTQCSSWKSHEIHHSDERKYSCQYCNKAFKTKSSMRRHALTHNSSRPFICGHCGSAFKSRPEVSYHTKLHLQYRPVKCQKCKQRFKNKSHLGRHLRQCLEIPTTEPVRVAIAQIKREVDTDEISTSKSGAVNKHELYSGFYKSINRRKRRFSCSYCDRTFPKLCQVKYHEVFHSNDRPFQCESCDKAFKTQSNLNRHNITHIDIRPFKCHMCGGFYKSKRNLTIHIKLHSQYGPYQCLLCPQSFKNPSALGRHRRVHIGVIGPQIYEAKIVESVKALQQNIKEEALSITDEVHTSNEGNNAYNIEIGSSYSLAFENRSTGMVEQNQLSHYTFETVNQVDYVQLPVNVNFGQHSQAAQNQSNHVGSSHAQSLGYSTYESHHVGGSSSSSYNNVIEPPFNHNHLGVQALQSQADSSCVSSRSKVTNRPYSCELCSKSFRKTYELTRHQKTHSNVYVCNLCSKRFITALDFKKHRKYHSAVLIKCDQCNEAFKSEGRLKVHQRCHSDNRPFKCNQCTKAYKYKQDLVLHLSTRHSDERPFPCDKCDQTYKLKRLLQRHQRIYHSDN